MKNENDISAELRGMNSILAGLSRKMPYAVPGDYFEKFGGALNEAIVELNKPDPARLWGKTLPFAAPAGYFHDLPEKIADMAKSETALTALPKDVPFTVPAGYFETLPVKALHASKAADNEAGTVKPLPVKRRIVLTSLKWMAAAILLITVGIGSYNMFYNQKPLNADNMLAAVPNDELDDYLQRTYRLDVDRVASNGDITGLEVDNSDIIEYLNETGWDVIE